MIEDPAVEENEEEAIWYENDKWELENVYENLENREKKERVEKMEDYY